MTVLRADGELEASGSYQSKKRMAKRAIVSAEKSGMTIYLYRQDGRWNYTKDEENACKFAESKIGSERSYICPINPDDSPHYRSLWQFGIDGEKLRESIDAEKFNWNGK